MLCFHQVSLLYYFSLIPSIIHDFFGNFSTKDHISDFKNCFMLLYGGIHEVVFVAQI